MLYILWFLIYFMATSYFNRNVEQLCCLRRFAYCFPLDCVRPIGKTLLRIFNHVLKLDIKWKREYLHPIFQEVYQKIFQ